VQKNDCCELSISCVRVCNSMHGFKGKAGENQGKRYFSTVLRPESIWEHPRENGLRKPKFQPQDKAADRSGNTPLSIKSQHRSASISTQRFDLYLEH
jgi:hypothetical protein